MSNVKRKTLSDQIRKAISDSGLSLYRIGKAGDVNAAALTRFMQGKSMTLTSVDRIAGVLGLGVVIDGPAAAASGLHSHGNDVDRAERPQMKKMPQRASKRRAGAKK